MKYFLSITMLLALFAACNSEGGDGDDVDDSGLTDSDGDGDMVVSVESISVSPEDIKLNIGEDRQLVATILPEDAENKNLTWESTETSVATVDSEGLISAIGLGSAKITATTEDGGFEADVMVFVSENKIYEISSEDFINPERGFYRYSETRSSSYSVLSVNTLRGYRNLAFSSGAGYQTYNSLVFRYYVMGDFTETDISDDYLSNMQLDFDAAREAGVKLIPRFTYTTTATAGDCSEGFICPPYGDASKEVVLRHIEQIGPLISDNADVILTVQMGFIGTWGENYYTDYFGDASNNDTQGKLLDENWEDRIEVLEAMLDAFPDEISVQVRYPQMKQRAVYGIDAPTTSAAMTESEAYDGSNKSRISFHNDCLFASADDFGTYADYGNSSTPRATDISTLKTYFADDSKYVVVGGETCSDTWEPSNDCSPTGMAAEDLRRLHYTYLNADYNNSVNNDWVDGGCIDEIIQNLGYRIQLDSATYPESVHSDELLDITLYFTNVGFAAPVKERPVVLILENAESNEEIQFEFDTDIRFWFDYVELDESFDLTSVPVGTYNLFLHLPDRHESIADRSEYAIRLANENMWDEESGYNDLAQSIEIIE